MAKDLYCPMIHGGLNINLKHNGQLSFNQCCLSTKPLTTIDNYDIWQNPSLQDIRKHNDSNLWHKDCWECERLENAGKSSFRTTMTNKFGVKRNLSGPQRIDLLFDRNCNLACVTCNPTSSTFWSKYLKDNNIPIKNYKDKSSIDIIFKTLSSLDLSNLEMVQFCGGETLLGNTYWKTAEFIANLVPDAHKKITLGFQTNGTQPIDEKNYEIIEKFFLVKLLISLDSTHSRFEYLRWPAKWQQVEQNILRLRETLPVNVMFFVQEVTSCLNLFYYKEVPQWLEKNFQTNRVTDPVEYATQLAMHNTLDVNNITREYYDVMSKTDIFGILKKDWSENPEKIKKLMITLDNFDKFRNKNWKKDFPEVADFYSRYL